MNAEILMIVDDDAVSRAGFISAAAVARFEPFAVTQYLRRPQDLVDLARAKRVDGVLCDHKLREANLAGFDGAEGAAVLNTAGIPAFLVTRWEPADVDIAIRPHRRRIPCLLHKRPRPSELRAAFEATRNETVKKQVLPERQPYRASLFVEEVSKDGRKPRIVVSIPQWDSSKTIPILLSSIPSVAQIEAIQGGWLLADVNINASSVADLYIDDIRLPPRTALKEYHAKVNRR